MGRLAELLSALVLPLAMWLQLQSLMMSCPVCRRVWQQEVLAIWQGAGKLACHRRSGPVNRPSQDYWYGLG